MRQPNDEIELKYRGWTLCIFCLVELILLIKQANTRYNVLLAYSHWIGNARRESQEFAS